MTLLLIFKIKRKLSKDYNPHRSAIATQTRPSHAHNVLQLRGIYLLEPLQRSHEPLNRRGASHTPRIRRLRMRALLHTRSVRRSPSAFHLRPVSLHGPTRHMVLSNRRLSIPSLSIDQLLALGRQQSRSRSRSHYLLLHSFLLHFHIPFRTNVHRTSHLSSSSSSFKATAQFNQRIQVSTSIVVVDVF